MLYENYQNKILRLSKFLAKVVKYMVLIIAVTVLCVSAVTALLAAKGLPSAVRCPSEVHYGESIDYRASAFLSQVRYEFRKADGGAWSKDVPTLPGTYEIRAIGRSSFGNDRYSEPATFTIVPRSIRIQVSEKAMVFGELPTVVYDSIREGDRLVCQDFIYSDITAVTTQVTPDASTVQILDPDGNDVSSAYDIETVTTDLTFQKRPLKVIVGNSSDTYDATAHSFDQYEIAKGFTLGAEDTLTAVFSSTLTNPGTIQNSPKLTVYHWQDGIALDVTGQYDIEIEAGKLTVEKRPLYLLTGSDSKTYDGQTISSTDYKFLPAMDIDVSDGAVITTPITTPSDVVLLVDGHELTIVKSTSAVDAGSYDNIFDVKITDADGRDVTDNYSIHQFYGMLTIRQAPFEFVTFGKEWVYDGQEHSLVDYETSGLLTGHSLKFGTINSITEVGSVSAVDFPIYILDEDGRNIASNYELTSFSLGRLRVTPRPITLRTGDLTVEYDSYPHQQVEYDIPSELSLVDTHRLIVTSSTTVTNVDDSGSNVFSYVILDDHNVSVGNNYEITEQWGTLTVTPHPITVSTPSQSWIYDGTHHELTAYSLSDPTECDYAMASIPPGSSAPGITNVGEIENAFDIAFFRYETNENVTSNYDITYDYGTLTIEARPVCIETGSYTWVYDDQWHSCQDWYYSPDSPLTLLGNHFLSIQESSKLKNAGVIENEFISYQILDDDNIDQTSNYDLTISKNGKLEILRREIILQPENMEKEYDGTPLHNGDTYVSDLSPYPLVETHVMKVIGSASRTEIGQTIFAWNDDLQEGDNEVIITEGDDDVSSNYFIICFEGYINIRPIRIVITSESDSKMYDGTPLTNPTFYIEGDFLPGHTIYPKVTGSITEPGTVSNKITADILDDVTGESVAKYYDLDFKPGKLTISTPETIFGQVKDDQDGLIYLRMESFGNYDGRNWGSATSYGQTLPNGLSYNYLSSLAMRNSGAEVHWLELSDLTTPMLPYYMGLDPTYAMPTDDVAYSYPSGSFGLQYYDISSINLASLKGNLGDYSVYEETYRSFVYEQYLTIDEETRSYMETIIDQQEFSLSDPDVIDKIAHYIQNAATYSLDYDPEMDQAANVAIAFLDQYRKGVCTHYASAATLLYRTLGIPARYVQGFMIETKKDDFVQIKSPGHAWVEVYCDGVGWIRVEVTGGMKDGIGDSEADTPDLKHTIEIMLYPIQKYYDGQPAVFQDGDYEIIAPDGVDVDLELNISITNVDQYRLKDLNMYTDTFASYRVYQNGVDVTEQYSIVFTSVNGTDENEIVIQVDPRKIQLATASQTKYDDGTALTNSSVTIVQGSLANGHHLETTVEGYIDVPGSTENIITYFRIVDDEGNDFSYCYDVGIILGTLTIIPAPEE